MVIWWIPLIFTGLTAAYREEEVFDPNDPTKGYSRASGLQQCELQEHILRDPTLRHIVRQMLLRLYVDLPNPDGVTRIAKVRLSKQNLEDLHNYLENTPIAEELQGRERVQWALENMLELDEDTRESVLEEFFRIWAPYLMLANVIVLPIAIFIVLRTVISNRMFWPTIFGIAFILSWMASYSRLYKEELARRIAQSAELQDANACEPPNLLLSVLETIGRRTVYIHKKTRCEQFIESQTIPAFFVVSPIDALTDVLANTIFGFIANTAQHFNKFFRNFYHDLPIFVQAIMSIFLFLLIGRIRTPLFSYEPILFTAIGDMWDGALRMIGHRHEAIEDNRQNAQQPALQNRALPPSNSDTSITASRSSRHERRSSSSPGRCIGNSTNPTPNPNSNRFANVTPRQRRMRMDKLVLEGGDADSGSRSRSSSRSRLVRDSPDNFD
ncbi:hypothetical protein WR25_09676 [Diploscapter pachys]|uniref:Chloride channel CLIC-like protein 1 n=1 Tax=Diploscapter pachys TaxID=2018661 RepID=A0A2A2K833_9BILA|nr:hypothetical protein WR25_09676 [Diploscapter pachys]